MSEEKKNTTDAAETQSEIPKSEVDKKPESGGSKKEVSSSIDKGADRPEGGRSQGRGRRNGRNGNKRRERHELPPNVDNLPSFSLKEMQEKDINDIKLIAEEYELQDFAGYGKHQLIFELLKTHGRRGGPLQGQGVLEVLPDGFGFLRSPMNSYQPSPDDIYVSPSQIRRFGLRTGDSVEGTLRAPKDKERFFALHFLDKINHDAPEQKRKTVPFENLTPLFPDERLVMETADPKEISMRVMDLVTPIGKGQRGLIVAPPRTGKTVLMQKMANSISENNPEAKLIILLIDERPEEVTDMRRNTKAEVLASTFDEPPDSGFLSTSLFGISD